MRHRTDHITSSLGHRLTLRTEVVEGAVRYLGLIDGRRCASGPTQEATICALLRRFAGTVSRLEAVE